MNQFNNEKADDVTKMEAEAKFKIITVEDEEKGAASSQGAKIIDDCKEAIAQMYASLRVWLSENKDSEEAQAQKAKIREESDRLIAAAKLQLQKLKENEDLRQAVDKGVKVAAETGDCIKRTVNAGVQEFRKTEGGQKVEAMVQSVKNDERVKKGVASFKKGTLKLAESAYTGLKKVLKEKEDASSADLTEVQDDETNHDL